MELCSCCIAFVADQEVQFYPKPQTWQSLAISLETAISEYDILDGHGKRKYHQEPGHSGPGNHNSHRPLENHLVPGRSGDVYATGLFRLPAAQGQALIIALLPDKMSQETEEVREHICVRQVHETIKEFE